MHTHICTRARTRLHTHTHVLNLGSLFEKTLILSESGLFLLNMRISVYIYFPASIIISFFLRLNKNCGYELHPNHCRVYPVPPS